MRKLIIFAAALALASGTVLAKGKGGGSSHSVRGYTKKDGSYVAPHRATNPDGRKSNNWSHKGNTNPYTGKEGTKE